MLYRMRRLSAAGCLMLYCSVLLGGGKTIIHSIHINGNRALSERQLFETMTSRTGGLWSPPQLTQDIESLLELYHDRGYYLAAVRVDSVALSSDTTAVEVVIGINEGEQVRVGRITCKGNSAMPTPEILKRFDTHIGGFLVPNMLEHDINLLLSSYESIGYPFAKVEVEN